MRISELQEISELTDFSVQRNPGYPSRKPENLRCFHRAFRDFRELNSIPKLITRELIAPHTLTHHTLTTHILTHHTPTPDTLTPNTPTPYTPTPDNFTSYILTHHNLASEEPRPRVIMYGKISLHGSV